MKHLLILLFGLVSIMSQAQTIRIGNTDRQKVDSLLVRNDSLVIQIENDIKRSTYLGNLSGLGDNLGDHVATTDLNMSSNQITQALSLDVGQITGNAGFLALDDDVSISGDLLMTAGTFTTSGEKRVNDQNLTTPLDWLTGVSGDEYYWSSENSSGSETFTKRYQLNPTGTPTNGADLVTKAYADATYTGGGSEDVILTQTEYDALGSPDPTVTYFIKDAPSGSVGASGIIYDNTTSGLLATDVQGAIDEIIEGGINQPASSVLIDDAGNHFTSNTVEGALQEIGAGGVIDTGQGVSSVTKSAGALETYDNSDITAGGGATAKRRWNRHTANDTVLLSSGITLYDQFWIEQNWTGADSTYIKKGPATTFFIKDSANAITSNGVVLKNRAYASIVALSNDVFFMDGDFILHTEAICTADPQEKFDDANAAADPNCTEAAATTGFGTQFGTASAQSSDPDKIGSNYIEFVASGNNARLIVVSDVWSAGDTFTISFRIKQTVGTTGGWFAWQNVTFDDGSGGAITSSWQDVTENVTVTNNGTFEIRFYATNGGSSGDTILVDNLSIIKTN